MQNNGIRIMSGVGSAIMVLLSTGCMTSSNDGRSAGRVVDDRHLTRRVERAFKDEPAYKFDSVGVKTYAGIVQLTGFVNIEAQKDRAQQLAENVSGVREVVNGIILKPVPQPTGRPRVQRIYSDSPVQSNPTASALPEQQPAPQAGPSTPPAQSYQPAPSTQVNPSAPPAQATPANPSSPANPQQRNGPDQDDNQK